jgi:hypothetical protein
MDTSTYEPLDGIGVELIRGGLPADYARRAASELADHRRDLVEELQASGWTESQAAIEASRRLGDPQALVKKTVREYQCRYWCGRWPLITFLLGPLPAFFVAFYVTGLVALGIGKLFGKGPPVTPIETWIGITIAYAAKIWLTLVIPALVVAFFCWRAMRAALGRYWPCLASVVLASFAGFLQCGLVTHPTQPHARAFVIGYYLWFSPVFQQESLLAFFMDRPWQIAQLVIPLAIACVALFYQASRIQQDLRRYSSAG